MARSTYIYSALVGKSVVIACTVKYEFLNRVQQAVDQGHMKIGEFQLFRTPDNGLCGNGAIITDQFEFDRSKQV
jgi:ornithine carbamoyltransferase